MKLTMPGLWQHLHVIFENSQTKYFVSEENAAIQPLIEMNLHWRTAQVSYSQIDIILTTKVSDYQW